MPTLQGTYLQSIAEVRATLPALNSQVVKQIEVTYARALAAMIKEVAEGRLTAERAAALSASIMDRMTALGIDVSKIVQSLQLQAAHAMVQGHQQAVALTAKAAGVATQASFTDVPHLAVEYLARRQSLAMGQGATGHAARFQALIRRNIQGAAGNFDAVLATGVATGADAKDVVRAMASLMAQHTQDPQAQMLLDRMGIRGGMRRNLSDTDKALFKSLTANEDLLGRTRKILTDARRLGINEVNNALFEADILAAARSPLVGGLQWTLSGRHKGLPSTPDRCDFYAYGDWFGLGTGLFPVEMFPPMPHPYCLCFPSVALRPPSTWATARPAPPPLLKLPTFALPSGKGVTGLKTFITAHETDYTGASDLVAYGKKELQAAQRALAAVQAFPLSGYGQPLSLTKIKEAAAQAASALATEALAQADEAWPADFAQLKDVGALGGSTGARKHVDPRTGRHYVVKTGASEAHLREEALVDALYRSLGVRVPAFKLYEAGGTTYKVAEFLEDSVTLRQYLQTGTPKGISYARRQLRQHYATDALLGNWDVIGLDLDNILVTMDGQIPRTWRVDNGGALRYRAQGALKAAQEFAGEVTELDSMRGLHSTIQPNRGAAWAFAKDGRTAAVSDKDIRKQVVTLLRREKMVMAALPDELKPIMTERFAYLRRWLEDGNLAPLKQAAGEVDDVFTAQLAQEVREKQMHGRSLLVDEGDIEDNQILVFTRKAADGSTETVMQLKVREDGYRKIAEALGAPAQGAVSPLQIEVNNHVETIKTLVKNVAYHATDGKYNAGTVAAAKDAMNALETLRAAGKISTLEARHWGNVYQATIKAMQAVEPLPLQDLSRPLTVVSNTPVPKGSAGWKSSAHTGWDAHIADYSQGEVGHAKMTLLTNDNRNALGNTSYTKGVKNGVTVRVVNATDPVRAMRGMVEVVMPGEVSEQQIRLARKALEDLGLDVSPASPEYLEALYLYRHIDVRDDLFTNADWLKATTILNDQSLSLTERRSRLYGIVKDKLPVPAPAQLAQLARGTTVAPGEGGWRTYSRFDFDAKRIDKLMNRIEYTHGTGMEPDDYVVSMIRQGGAVTSTSERVRRGVTITVGNSPYSDLINGPADFYFTQRSALGTRTNAYGRVALTFKPSKVLGRLQNWSFNGDYMDHITVVDKTDAIRASRASTPEGAKVMNHYRNETLIKRGFHLRDVKTVYVKSLAQQDRIIQEMKRAGYTSWYDGRSFTEVIQIRL